VPLYLYWHCSGHVNLQQYIICVWKKVYSCDISKNGYRYLIVIDDIWRISAWEQVQCALPVNNRRSRIITTTRSKEVARSCCAGIDGHIYEAKPLSEDDSRRLFFRKLSHSSEECPQVLRAVASEILRKCGGLPLAIISIAGLLGQRRHTVEEWGSILNSVSSAVGGINCQIQKMKRILFLSYFDLPCYLKSCLLYLSVFPEDYSIDCRQLIRLWVAEGLIPGQNRESMELLGVSYLNELINRSTIQPTKIRADGAVKFIRVHDVVLDFIISQAVEENFVVVGKGDFSGNSSNKMRRLSIQRVFSGADQAMAQALKNNVGHLRSVHIFDDSDQLVDHIPVFFNSHTLRVLNIQGRLMFGGRNNIRIGSSFSQLKYLLVTGWNWELPLQIGRLQHLETLDVKSSGIHKLPASIVELKRLVRLLVPADVQMPDGIGALQALEELSKIDLDISSAKAIKGLGDLTKLRVLIVFSYHHTNTNDEERDTAEGRKEACISSLSKLLMCLRTLYLAYDSDVATALLMASCGSTSTPPLQRLYLPYPLTTIPSQVRSLANLVRLRISVQGGVSKEGLEILASLPMLVSLTLRLRFGGGMVPELQPRHIIGRYGFQSLVKFSFGGECEAALEFEAGAMPKVQRLKLELQARCQFKYGQTGLVVGLHNLSILKQITASINCSNAMKEDVECLEDDIRWTAGSHPNRPQLMVKREQTEGYDSLDDARRAMARW